MGNCQTIDPPPPSPVQPPASTSPAPRAPGTTFIEQHLSSDLTLSTIAIPFKALRLGERLTTHSPPWECVRPGTYTGTPVLVKQLFRTRITEEAVERFARVTRLVIDMHHPNIVQCIGASWDSESSICMVTEQLARGDLATLLQSPDVSLSPEASVRMMLDVARGMTYLHAHTPQVLHRDLKCANIHVTTDFKAKIANFEFSREKTNGEMTLLGSPIWTAPEILRGQKEYDEKVDVYSFAIVMVEIMTRQMPYAELAAEKMKKKLLVTKIAFEGLRPSLAALEATWPPALLRLAETCWAEDAAARPSFPSTITTLQEVLATLENSPSAA
ncbi:TKL/DRK protein kinase [Saprolegnia parasitica CBS 223.65]|uniref:TKL/DRK protein kinase n=1 Tax=Saprolegnia parasitica (strain CBS 223.65) TaxID=695850 RepID=A0A067CC89_SAPPC|nr:TKL/DRK protein kinase [Saprolegnia parasitica CBS 223.65]KDO28108.1 TKL/DRK protein kinase [Saprolegnia parasitica CBS 223.65]|eukprot:XP_012201249.1 TKL/DRK protein kinase [Saprolegnia parasitica CBS 223.65]